MSTGAKTYEPRQLHPEKQRVNCRGAEAMNSQGPIPLVMYFLQQASTSQKFFDLLKQLHHLGTSVHIHEPLRDISHLKHRSYLPLQHQRREKIRTLLKAYKISPSNFMEKNADLSVNPTAPHRGLPTHSPPNVEMPCWVPSLAT